jgi:hypothetical protein
MRFWLAPRDWKIKSIGTRKIAKDLSVKRGDRCAGHMAVELAAYSGEQNEELPGGYWLKKDPFLIQKHSSAGRRFFSCNRNIF